jgi:RNA polymerase sigma-70 factor (ECF subfamily)
MGRDTDWQRVADLVHRAREGDDEAFRDLLQSHRAAVTSTLVACGVRTAGTAEDLAQEVALRAWSRLDALTDPRSFPAWVRRITANCARDHLRRLAVRREQELEWALNLAGTDDPHQLLERSAELRLMMAALLEEDEEIVELLTARADGVPVAVLADRSGLSEAALKMRLSRARGRLRRRLDELRRGRG